MRINRLDGAGGVLYFARDDQDWFRTAHRAVFIRTIGHHSLGLGYALISTDVVLGSIIPSTEPGPAGLSFHCHQFGGSV